MALADQLRKEVERSSINIVLNFNELRIYENIIKRCFTAARNGLYSVNIKVCNVNDYSHLTIDWEKILRKLKTEKTLGFTLVKENYNEEGILDSIYLNWVKFSTAPENEQLLTDADIENILNEE